MFVCGLNTPKNRVCKVVALSLSLAMHSSSRYTKYMRLEVIVVSDVYRCL